MGSDQRSAATVVASPYRKQMRDLRVEVAPRRTWWRWLACFVRGGHRWRVTRENPRRASALLHLHHMAGCDATCVRCGAVWLDADPTFDAAPDVVDVEPYEVRG